MVISEMAYAFREEATTSEGDDHVDWPEKYLDRLEKEIGDVKTELRGVNQRIDGVNERIDGVNGRIDILQTNINERFNATDQKIDSNNHWIIALVIGTLASFAALVVTIWLAH